MEGWICPRCSKVNAPWIASCDCKPAIVSPAYPPAYQPLPYTGDPLFQLLPYIGDPLS